MEQILSWVKSGLLFGIISSIALLLCPNKSYEKHMSLIVGLLFILVMIHPVMTFLNLDGETYISYIQNYIAASENGDELNHKETSLYEETISFQLERTLNAAGYNISYINVKVDDKGSVYEVTVSFAGTVGNVEEFEKYIKNVFGEEVDIIYE